DYYCQSYDSRLSGLLF
nr:immunoglobulin light chain junction region [Macaca mulatta]MOX31007.1 immunoglobulin light chain junction region [Macaca mulatta]MOX32176.1 immunoglobulin light chain junction region [Macaca mulatta]MOX32266.1 immunoglobulin light chain junction region [Macaca mulatta]